MATGQGYTRSIPLNPDVDLPFNFFDPKFVFLEFF